ncbi:Fibrinogen-like protein 1,Fibrinogen-like protein A,Tenascin,Ryncolin-2,Ryncolin-4,Fibrinogen C domain-containing protein 1-A,Angiopoietin-2,Ficolin-2,Ryncolin-1,Tenascin-R,Ryncolin-3,Ficolin-1,Fibrinogen C domain-containing protein 1-B,Fibrinogen C domain-containing protein 1 [Mytilus coruscus]|uniref:Fibrinogen C-terminal domain-containing protein n=1 Tax=Mytilus coruscus TaxID=42192 RepID=A0A6J8EAZ2_MYTCO|nr:Fibrinogen-like protein 1,Fibrinogen-like protein A,Tenascin,Ryncolin-2,Ryncolin-4,Fibrinogen C domain-containing protein 1-A,Angiopoietin-2,Ficolin-2,Ryncolin-1,Tenascin-R,Ryncolin-3,Ficolin-1,Fibrinogen C domain-containing protein 1-B,Fibrinogen C domain-containing protein 1 [Mytilus coruscus]
MTHEMPHCVMNYVLACSLLLNFNIIFCQQCTVRTLRVDPDKTESRHHGYTFITFEQIGPNTCFDECIRRPRCLSFNYNRIKRHCEINEGNHETDVVEGSNYVYVNIEQYKKIRIYDPCSTGMSCLLGEICKTMKNGTGHCVKDMSPSQPVTDCSRLHKESPSGTYTIRTNHFQKINVYCDMDTDGGGWTVFQRRCDGFTDFYRGWNDYESGFGNRNIHAFTSQRRYQLRIDLKDFQGNTRYAVYSTFSIGDADSKYKLTIGGYTGTAGDSMKDPDITLNGMMFSTTDQDNDEKSKHCARDIKKGPWWHRACSYSNLNSQYKSEGFNEGQNTIHWKTWHGVKALKVSEMKIKPLFE